VSSLNPLNALPHGFTHRRRRGAELFLLVLALMVGVGAYAAVGSCSGSCGPSTSGLPAGSGLEALMYREYVTGVSVTTLR